MANWKAAENVDAVRGELRNAIFWMKFMANGTKAEGRGAETDDLKQRACAFVEFGVRAGLIPPAEGNEWLDAVWDRTPLADVMEKYHPTKEETPCG